MEQIKKTQVAGKGQTGVEGLGSRPRPASLRVFIAASQPHLFDWSYIPVPIMRVPICPGGNSALKACCLSLACELIR
jgi:hypothetical protein